MSLTIRDNPDASQFEIAEDGVLAGFVRYRLTDVGQIAFTHTQVIPEFARRNLAGQLVAHALEDARRRGLAVLPFCPYVARQIRRNPSLYIDLVPADQRVRFGLIDHSS